MAVVNKTSEKRNVIRLGTNATDTQITQENYTSNKKDFSRSISVFNQAMDLGFAIAVPIAGGALLGVYLDKRFNTSPKLTLSLLFFGIFVGIYSVFKIIQNINE